MDYIISNDKFSNGKKINDLYVKGECIDKYFIKVSSKQSISNINMGDLDSLYFYSKAEIGNEKVTISGDFLGFCQFFYYWDEVTFTGSTSLNILVDTLIEQGKKLTVDLDFAKEFLIWGNNIRNKHWLSNISILGANEVLTYDGGIKIGKSVTKLKTTQTVSDPKVAANNIHTLNESYFKHALSPNESVGVGLSGGLDSRVGAYFAARTGAKIIPFFVGDEKSYLGFDTFDASISKKIANELALGTVEFISPDRISWQEKLENDFNNALSSTSNAHTNVGYNFGFNTLVNGSMGGELFGACISNDYNNISSHDLASKLLTQVDLLPKQKYEYNIIAKIAHKTGISGQLLALEKSEKETLVDSKLLSEVIDYVTRWVEDKSKAGFSNIQIAQLYLYEKVGRNHQFGYFYGLNNKIDVVPTYLRPEIIEEMLSWEDDLFIGKPVQRELMKMLGNLGHIKSQNIGDELVGYKGVLSTVMSRANRLIRGGGMNYQLWLKNKRFKSLEVNYSEDIFSSIDSQLIKSSPNLRLNLIKISMAARKLKK